MRIAAIYIGLALVCPALLSAAENPFELPAPRNPLAPGYVMLHGGGHGLQNEVRREFVRLAGGRRARIVLMPSDQAQRGLDSEGNPAPDKESMTEYVRRLSRPGEYGRWVTLRELGEVADFQFLIHDPQGRCSTAIDLFAFCLIRG